MKSYNHLFTQICSFSALMSAAKKAALGKKKKRKIAEFLFDLEPEIIKLEQELRDKYYQPLPYRTFMVTDPKERKICAAHFRDRVVHHAVCNVLESIFEKSFISDSYACWKNKGRQLEQQRQELPFGGIFTERYRPMVVQILVEVDAEIHHQRITC